MSEEQVALYDATGAPVGSAPRSQMRADNLHHAATAVVVFDPQGAVYVHQRTAAKDVYPSRHDFAAGGVVAAGETPEHTAARELTEELGISGAVLHPIDKPLAERTYRDAHTSYVAFCWWTVWDGPIVWQPTEVASGQWLPVPDVLEWINRSPDEWMPDTVAVLADWLKGHTL